MQNLLIKTNNLSETEKLAENITEFSDLNGMLFCLYGDIGSGKTAFKNSSGTISIPLNLIG
jgi:tRNA A37 threonylcarbamoyladenosine biosynthesis protein TsaE